MLVGLREVSRVAEAIHDTGWGPAPGLGDLSHMRVEPKSLTMHGAGVIV